MKKWYLFSRILMLTMVLAVVSCNKTDDNPTPTSGLDRKPMLENYANNYIVLAYNKMQEHIELLQQSVNVFVKSPTEFNLSQIQNNLQACYFQWQAVALYEFGPAEEIALRTYMNTYPVTLSKLDKNIAAGGYNLEEFGNKDAQGLPAVDYLAHGLSVDAYTTDALAENRKKYLQDIVNKMVEKVTDVNIKWGSYKTDFIKNTSTDANSSISQLVNGTILYYERYLRGGKVGIPVGAMTGNALPANVESLYTPENSIRYLNAAIIHYKAFYKSSGSNDPKLQSYLAELGTKDDNGTLIAQLIEDELTEAGNKLAELDGTLVDNINNNRTAVLQIYDELQDVVPLLKVDMVSALSISITYTDNDGD